MKKTCTFGSFLYLLKGYIHSNIGVWSRKLLLIVNLNAYPDLPKIEKIKTDILIAGTRLNMQPRLSPFSLHQLQ